MSNYKKIFEPVNIGKLKIKNRIAMAPLATGGMVSSDGKLTQRAVEYYRARIMGGTGLIVTGNAKVENEVEKILIGHDGKQLISPRVIPRLSELAEISHYYGAKLFVQLLPGEGRNNSGTFYPDYIVSASAIPSFFKDGVLTRELTIDEIKQLVVAFGKAAKILKECDVDGIEINAHDGYLLDNFQTSLWNKRKDKYGGDLKGRLTLSKEILEQIKNAAGDDFPVTYKFGMKHFMKAFRTPGLKEENFKEAGRDIDEGIELAKAIEELGYDGLVPDTGGYDSWYWAFPPLYMDMGCLLEYTEAAKKVVNIPIFAIGRMDDPHLAEEVLEKGIADIIMIGRGLLADPDWPNKVRKGEEEDIKPCIACNEGCLGRDQKERNLSCAVNPATGGELYFGLEPVLEKKKILIAGGGVAGMEAAIVSKKRGHDVVLYERTSELGGHLREASVPDFKKDLLRLLDWYKNQIKKLNIKVYMNKEVTPQIIEKEKPDAVIVATGSANACCNIDGANDSNIIYATDLLLGKKEVGKDVVVIGGGMIGLETALWLAKQGKKVTVVEKLPEVAVDGALGVKEMLIDMVKYNGVEIKTNTEAVKINKDGIKLLENGKAYNYVCNNVVIALGLAPDEKLFDRLVNKFPNVDIFQSGDCKSARKIMNSIWDSYHISRSI
jgi:2-enoate reductase